MDDEEGWVVRGDVGDRVCQGRLLGILLDRPADEPGFGGIRRVVVHPAALLVYPEQVGGAEEVADGLYPARFRRVSALAFEGLDLTRGPQQGDQMTSGGGAPDADPIRVDAELIGSGPKEPDRGLAVLDLGRKVGLTGEPVFDRGPEVPPASSGGKSTDPAIRAATSPGTSVNPDDHRHGGTGSLLRPDHVKTQRTGSRGAVLDIPDDFNTLGKVPIRIAMLSQGVRRHHHPEHRNDCDAGWNSDVASIGEQRHDGAV